MEKENIPVINTAAGKSEVTTLQAMGRAARMRKIEAYPEIHQQGLITIEKGFSVGTNHGDLGIQIATDGRIWLCIDGIAVIRFRPFPVK